MMTWQLCAICFSLIFSFLFSSCLKVESTPPISANPPPQILPQPSGAVALEPRIKLGINNGFLVQVASRGAYTNVLDLYKENNLPVDIASTGIDTRWQRNWFPNKTALQSASATLALQLWGWVLANPKPGETQLQTALRNRDYLMVELARLTNTLLTDFQGRVYVVIEPESTDFKSLAESPEFGKLAATMAHELRRLNAPNTKLDLKIGMGFLDGGSPNVAGPGVWDTYKPSLEAAAPAMDFMAFTRYAAGLRRRNGQCVPRTPEEENQPALPDRIVDLSQYLKNTYGKPVMASYLQLMTYTAPGQQDWDDLQAQVWRGLRDRQDKLQSAGVFAILNSGLFESPSVETAQNLGAAFCGAESYGGLLKAANPLPGLDGYFKRPFTDKKVATAFRQWLQDLQK